MSSRVFLPFPCVRAQTSGGVRRREAQIALVLTGYTDLIASRQRRDGELKIHLGRRRRVEILPPARRGLATAAFPKALENRRPGERPRIENRTETRPEGN